MGQESASKVISAGLHRSGIGVGFNKLTAAALHLAMNALVARLLTPSDMGVFFLVVSISTFAGMVGQFGLNQTAVRVLSYARGRNDMSEVRSTVFNILILGTFSAAIAAIVLLFVGRWIALSWLNSAEVAELVPFLALWSFFIALHSLFAEMLRGMSRVVLATIFDSTRPLAPAFLLVFVFSTYWISGNELSLEAVVALCIGSYIAGVLSCSLLILRLLPQANNRFRLRLGELLSKAWPLMIHQATWIGVNYSTLWVLAFFGTSEGVAMYGTAFLFIQIVAFPMVVMYATLSPRVAELHVQKRIAAMGRLLRKGATLTAVPGMLLLALMAVFGRNLMGYIFGDIYSSAYPILLVLGVGQVFNLWAGSAAIALSMTGFQRILMAITVVSGGIAVLSAAILVHQYGVVGVAAGYSFGLIIHTLATTFAVHARLKIWPQMYTFDWPSRA